VTALRCFFAGISGGCAGDVLPARGSLFFGRLTPTAFCDRHGHRQIPNVLRGSGGVYTAAAPAAPAAKTQKP
jgi:hypothetical protein